MPKKTCLVTGCAGFVGSHITDELLAMGHAVIGVDNFFSGHRHNMARFESNPNFTFVEACITEKGLIQRLKGEHPELTSCFHLAAIVSVPYSIDHERETMAVNWEASRSLYESARRLGFKSFVYAGSAAEYGDTKEFPVAEKHANDQTTHFSPYGKAKYLTSRLISQEGFGTSLRSFNIFGPRQDPTSPYSGVISIFMNRSLAGQSLTIFGDGSQTRDFIYISDVVNAYLMAAGLLGEAPLQGIFNVARGEETTVLQMAETIQKLTGSQGTLGFAPARPGDIHRSVADISKLRSRGFTPTVGIDEGLRITLGSLHNY